MAVPVPVPHSAHDAHPEHHTTDDEPIGPVTFEEYLAYSETADRAYELVNGYMYPLAGVAPNNGTVAHGAIALNIAARLRTLARGSGCRVYGATVGVRTLRGDALIPDALVTCGPRPDNEERYVTAPCLVIEVLSPSTRRFDENDKSSTYRELPSLQACWLVEATWRCVHRHWRDVDGVWRFEQLTGDAVLPAPCPVGATLTLGEVYEDVDLPTEAPRAKLRRVREPDAEYVFEEECVDALGDAAATTSASRD